jgi:hypothetical protein
MNAASKTLVASLLVLSAACVTSRAPVGSQVHSIREDDWNGTWITGDGRTAHIKVLDEANGILECSITDKDHASRSLTNFQVRLLEHDGWVFANLTEPTAQDQYAWARVGRVDEQLIVWYPEEETIREMVAHGELPGVLMDPAGVTLDRLDDEQLTAITQGLHGIAVMWEMPWALIRIAKE